MESEATYQEILDTYPLLAEKIEEEWLAQNPRHSRIPKSNYERNVNSLLIWSKTTLPGSFWENIYYGGERLQRVMGQYPQYFKIPFKNGVRTKKNGLLHATA